MLTQSDTALVDKLRRATGEEDWGILEDADLIAAADAIERAEARAEAAEKALADLKSQP